jgi:hypothetical protein
LGISLYTIFIEVILHQGDIGIKCVQEHSYQENDSMVLISFDEDEDDEELPKSQTPWLHQ